MSQSACQPPPINVVNDQACPRCGAEQGESCRNPQRRKNVPHVARVKAAYRAADVYSAHFNPEGRFRREGDSDDKPWEDEDPRHYAHRMGDPGV